MTPRLTMRDWDTLAVIFGFHNGGDMQDFALRAQAKADIAVLRRVDAHRRTP